MLNDKTQEFDYIIAGAGSSGCVLASRLSEDPDVTVLVVEAGGADRSFLFRWPAGFAKMTKGIASWGWSTVPQKHLNDRVLWYTQAKVLGGGSTINAQVYTRGNARDYDAWAEEGCNGWSYRDILPYFKRAEGNERFHDDYHGSEGPLGVSASRGTLPVADAFSGQTRVTVRCDTGNSRAALWKQSPMQFFQFASQEPMRGVMALYLKLTRDLPASFFPAGNEPSFRRSLRTETVARRAEGSSRKPVQARVW